MARVISIVLFVAVAACSRESEPHALNAALKELAKQRLTAFAQRDTSTLSAICHPDFQLISPDGSRMDAALARRAIAQSTVLIRQFTLVSFQTFVSDNETMAFAVAEVNEEVVRDKSVVPNTLLITEVYVKIRGEWKVQLTHVSQRTCFFPN